MAITLIEVYMHTALPELAFELEIMDEFEFLVFFFFF